MPPPRAAFHALLVLLAIAAAPSATAQYRNALPPGTHADVGVRLVLLGGGLTPINARDLEVTRKSMRDVLNWLGDDIAVRPARLESGSADGAVVALCATTRHFIFFNNSDLPSLFG